MKKLTLLVLFALFSVVVSAESNISGIISTDSVFSIDHSPYIVTSNLTVAYGATVTVETGVTVKLANNVSINVYGTLSADGAVITSNSDSPSAGSWSKINIGTSLVSGQLNLTNTTVEYAYGIDVQRGNANVSGSTLQSFSGNGVTLSTSSASLTLNSSTIASTEYPLYLAEQCSISVSTANTFTNNTYNFACLNFQSISEDWTMTALSIPYKPIYSLTVNTDKTLTLSSGCSLAFGSSRSLTVAGSLIGNNATLTSSAETPTFGSWSTLYVGTSTNSGTVQLTNCTVEYARTMEIVKGSAVLTNTDLTDFSYYGVEVNSNTSLVMSGGSVTTESTTAYSSYDAIYLNSNATASLDGVTLSGFDLGLYLSSSSSTAILDGCTLSSLGTPIYFKEPASLTVNIPNTFTDNKYNRAYIYFTEIDEDWEVPTLSISYDFRSGFKINSGAEFITNSNNIFKISSNYAFDVYGTLTAVAKTGENIYFTATTDDNWGGDSNGDANNTAAERYSWIGIRLYYAEASASELIGCKVRFTGYSSSSRYDYGSVTCYNSSPTISDCEFSINKYGLTLFDASKPIVSNSTFASSSQTAIAMSFEADPVFNNNTLSFSDNAYDAIGLLGGTLTADATIRKRNFTNVDNITYYMLSSITVPDTLALTIDPGIVIKSHSGCDINVYGTLNAVGTTDEHIVFTSSSDDNFGNPGDTNKDGTQNVPSSGHIGNINFYDSSNDTSLVSYCELRYPASPAIYTQDASPSIENNSIIQTTDGVHFYGASKPVLSNNKFINITNIPVTVSSAADPSFSGNTFTNVGLSALGLQGGDVTQSGTISKKNLAGYDNITYLLTSSMTINEGTYVDVEPGIVMKMSSTGGRISVEGGFRAHGTDEEKIIFTSFKDDNFGNPKDTNGDGNATSPSQDNWSNIYFTSYSDDDYCSIRHVDILYSGDGSSASYTSAIGMYSANPTIKNAYIFQSGAYGISIRGNSSPIIDSVTIQNSSWDPIGMSLASDPHFSNMTFVANRSQGLAIIDATLATDATLAKRDVAGIENIAYILNSSLTVASNSKLTINPGVVLKPKGSITINGALIAEGTPEERISFTSLYDDSRGGDTNNNGNNSSPSTGNWIGVYFTASGIDSLNSLKYVDLRYAYSPLEFTDCKAVVDSCVIEQAGSYCVSVNGSATPVVSNCQMMNCSGFYIPGIGESYFKNNQLLNITDAPVKLSTFTKAKFEDNTMANVGIQAIELLAETYSQSDTIPFRSFAGFDSITYYINNNRYYINNGTELTIPAGMVFKFDSYYYDSFTVNGKLVVAGTKDKPVIFTYIEDDSCGNPLDTKRNGKTSISRTSRAIFNFTNVSDDESSINYAELRHASDAFELYSASPNINNCLIESCNRGIYCNGVSEPKLRGNTFNNLSTSPFSISLVAYPSVLENNVISGSTYKMIEVNSETSTQDITLKKRDFAGVTNMPYYFPSSYTVGSGAVLSIEPGVICKLKSSINVNKGLLAQGGSTPDSAIVFTSIYDDFYGGDSNSDGATTSTNKWSGIDFNNTCIESECKLNNVVLKDISGYAITTESTSPSITNCLFENMNSDVIRAEGASQPTIDSCDFVNVSSSSYAIDNVHNTFIIDATNCWWGDTSGPEHSTNPDGVGSEITDDVNYSPFVTKVNRPQLGDVSRNSIIQAYDASLVLLSTVGDLVLDTKQKMVANVSGNTGENAISAYDASLILQKVVGMISYFGEVSTALKSSANSSLDIIDSYSEANGDVLVPIEVSGLSNIVALQTQIQFDGALLTYEGIEQTDFTDGVSIVDKQIGNNINISIAAASLLPSSGTVVNLKFRVKSALSGDTELKLTKFIVNEDDMSALASVGHVLFEGTSQISNSTESEDNFLKVYPNPFSQSLNISYSLSKTSDVSIDIYSIYGQHMVSLIRANQVSGKHTIEWQGDDATGNRLATGVYLVRISDGINTQTMKVHKY